MVGPGRAGWFSRVVDNTWLALRLSDAECERHYEFYIVRIYVYSQIKFIQCFSPNGSMDPLYYISRING